jgi:hypothetical protein
MTFHLLYGVISQKTEFFVTTAVRTSNPTRIYVRLDVLTAVTKKSTIFFVLTPYTSIEIHRCFRGMYRFYLQKKRASQTSKRQTEI